MTIDAKPPLELPRVLFYGGKTLDRRLRMTMKTVAELRRRRWSFAAIACAEAPEEFVRVAPPDEVHTDLSEAELVRLFCSSSVVLETSDQQQMLSPAFRLGMALGIPTVCHRDGAAPGEGCLPVVEWSADGFADALIAGDFTRPRVRDAAELERSLELFEQVLIGRT